MKELSEFLKTYMQEHGYTLRDMELRSRVSKSVLHNLIIGKEHEPRLTTLVEIARAVELPLWRVIEMAGVDIGLPKATSYEAERLVSLAKQRTEFQTLFSGLLMADSRRLRNVIAYLASPDDQQIHDLRVNIVGDRQRTLIDRLLKLKPQLFPALPPRQNVYEGANVRPSGGGSLWAVTVNGVNLGEALGGFRDLAWGYLGAGPSALADAMLRYEYGLAFSTAYREAFYHDVTSTLPKGRERTGTIWSLESQDLDLWLILARLAEPAARPPEPGAAAPQ